MGERNEGEWEERGDGQAAKGGGVRQAGRRLDGGKGEPRRVVQGEVAGSGTGGPLIATLGRTHVPW